MTRRILKALAVGLLGVTLLGVIFIVVQLNRRPSLEQYASRLIGPAPAHSALRVRFAGVATLVFDDGETAWMTDGFFSRPSFARLAFTRIEPDRTAIERGLRRLEVDKLAAVVPLHSHYDHAMDAPLVAMRTGAQLIGSESTLNVGRGLGMPEGRMRKVIAGESVALGRWKLTFIASRHVPLPIARGSVETIDRPLVPPARATAWAEGQTWAIVVEHASGARMLVLGSAGFVPGSLEGRRVDTVLLGIGTVGTQSREYRAQWWHEVVQRVGARRVIPIHWDDFSRSLDQPLVAFPYLIDDVAASMADLSSWAAQDRIEFRLPPLFTAFSP
jgi:L-ascorbate metabolism protein UlaG (beta-lactamase superfamily)